MLAFLGVGLWYHNHRGQVYRELELDKALEIFVNSAPPLDSLHNGGKTVVQQHNIAGLLGHLGAGDAHGDAHIRVFERRGIVDAVPGDRHHISQRF